MSSKAPQKPFRPTRKQIKAARMLLEITQSELATASGVSRATVENFEVGKSTPIPATMDRIVDALAQRGIEFTNGDDPGVILRQSKATIPPSQR